MSAMLSVNPLGGALTKRHPILCIRHQICQQNDFPRLRQSRHSLGNFLSTKVGLQEQSGPLGHAISLELLLHAGIDFTSGSRAPPQKGLLAFAAEIISSRVWIENDTACQGGLFGPIAHNEAIAGKGKHRRLETKLSNRLFSGRNLFLIEQNDSRRKIG